MDGQTDEQMDYMLRELALNIGIIKDAIIEYANLLKELVEMDPMDSQDDCFFCGVPLDAPHKPDCLWLRINQALRR